MTELVSTVCQDMALIREKGITLEWDVQKDIFCKGNQELLTRLLVNLITNGYRYGREQGFIKVSLKETQEQIKLIVSDNGIGIPIEEQEKIFHCGPSSKDGGMRIGSIVEIREREAYHTLVDELLKMPELQIV